MTDKEFRRLSRRQLVEIIYALQKQEKACREQLAAAQEQLERREMKMSRAGSIAEAALSLNDVFQHAQAAANQYVGEVERVYNQANAEAERIIEEARQQAARILAEAEAERDAVRRWTGVDI